MTRLDGIARILAIRFARLGDVTLLLPSLGGLKDSFRDAKLTLMTGSPYAQVGELCPWVDDVIPVDRLGMRDGSRRRALTDILGLVKELRARRFDLVVDFHSFRETNLLAWMSGARYRIGMKRSDRAYLAFCFNLSPALEDKTIHVAEMFQRVVEAIPGGSVRPQARPAIQIGTAPADPDPDGSRRPRVAFYVGASVATRRWPSAHFSAVIRHVIESWNAAVLIIGGISPEEQSIAAAIGAGVGDLPEARLLANLSVSGIAEAIASANLLVSNDTGPMHIGSALGVPTLGIFSQSLPRHYRPVGPCDRYIWKESVDEIETGEVLEVLEEMRAGFRSGNPGRRP